MLLRTHVVLFRSRSNRIVPITWKDVCSQQWDKADVHLQHYGMWEPTEGITHRLAHTHSLKGNVLNFCEGELNSCVREVHRVGRQCRCITAINMLFLEYPSVEGDEEQLATHWLLVAILPTEGKLLAFFMSSFCVLSTLGLTGWSSFPRRSS